jgi:SAM-dependent methyltransferase
MNQSINICFEESVLQQAKCESYEGPSDELMPRLLTLQTSNNWSREGIQRLVEGDWIRHNWENENQQSESGIRKQFCDELSDTDGIVLEIAAGPGGGNLSPMLHRDASKEIIVNDISSAILRLWQDFLCKKAIGNQVLLAAFDARRHIFNDDAIAAISSMAGLSETGDADNVLSNCYKALVPGGALFCFEHVVDSGDWERIPTKERQEWESKIPGFICGYRDVISSHGFSIEIYNRECGRTLDKDQGDIAFMASRYDVELHTTWEWIKARKVR